MSSDSELRFAPLFEAYCDLCVGTLSPRLLEVGAAYYRRIDAVIAEEFLRRHSRGALHFMDAEVRLNESMEPHEFHFRDVR